MKFKRLRLLVALATASLLPLSFLAPPSRAQAASPLAGRSPEELRRLAEQAGYTPQQIREQMSSHGATPDRSTAAAIPDSTALAPPEAMLDTASVAPATPAATGSQPFGYEIFRYSPTTFEPLAYGPVDSEYPLGPGDQLVITMWGDAQLSLAVAVNREGAVALPDVGAVQVNGLTLDEARSRIRGALARVYSGLRETGARSTTSLDVSIGKLRAIQVFLIGNVVKPGGYTVSSVSRVLNALYIAGGATRQGSLRDVRVMRAGRLVASIDLYDLLLRGDVSRETRLQNGDVIFVPAVGRRVQVSGPLRRNGLFELREDENLAALLAMAGGPMAEADVARAQIHRIVPPALRDSLRGQNRMAIDVSLAAAQATSGADVPLYDADSLVAFAVGNDQKNTVAIRGLSVMKPGDYEYRPQMRLSDLVRTAGGLKAEAFLERAQVIRTADDRMRSVLRVDLTRALAGEAADDLPLLPRDELTILSKWDVQQRGRVTISGLVHRPGEYEYLEGMTLADLLFRAGGLTEDALAAYAELARVDLDATGAQIADTLRVPIERLMSATSPGSAFALERWDAVFVRRDPDYREQVFVEVNGEVRFPGRYALMRRDERISDLVRRAGGFTEFAYPPGASFSRLKAPRLGIDLPSVMRSERAASNLVLESGDLLRVPRFQPTVAIEGAVLNPVTALYRRGAGVSYYVTQANGFRPDADRRKAVVVQANGNVQKGGAPGPGSRIVIPAKAVSDGKDRLKDVATIMTILASAATTMYMVGQASK